MWMSVGLRPPGTRRKPHTPCTHARACRLLVTAKMVAAKFYDDKFLSNAY